MEVDELFKFKTDMSSLRECIQTLPNECKHLSTIQVERFRCGSARVKGKIFTANLEVSYMPGSKILELISFNEYLNGFMQQAGYHEIVANQIFRDLKQLLVPESLNVKLTSLFSDDMKTTIEFSL